MRPHPGQDGANNAAGSAALRKATRVSDHLNEPYGEVEMGFQEGFARGEPDPHGGVPYEGACPRCAASMRFTVARGLPGGADMVAGPLGRRSVETAARPATITVYCTCGFPHERRPADADENGCGAYWTVKR